MSEDMIVRDLVSIIIPTYKRPDVLYAADSALAQTYKDIEVIVVSDGPDPDTRKALEGYDPRLRYLELAANSGPAEARNVGVRVSHGEWISFLDDDDTILPEKIAHQIQLASREEPHRMIACRTIYRHDGKDDVWPRKPLAQHEDVSDYILLRPGLLERPGVIPIQTLLVHHSLLKQVPLRTEADHEDWSWLLDVWYGAGARVEFLWEPLVVYNILTDSVSRSRRTNWRDSLEWAQAHRTQITRRAFNSFLSTKAALKAKRAGNRRALSQIAGIVLRNRPSLLDLLFLSGVAVLPGFALHAAWKRSLSGSNNGAIKPSKHASSKASGVA